MKCLPCVRLSCMLRRRAFLLSVPMVTLPWLSGSEARAGETQEILQTYTPSESSNHCNPMRSKEERRGRNILIFILYVVQWRH